MDKKIGMLDEPMNANERLLYAVSVRLDAIIHMMSSFMEVYANQNGMATTSNTVKEEVLVKPAVVEEAKGIIKPKKSRK